MIQELAEEEISQGDSEPENLAGSLPGESPLHFAHFERLPLLARSPDMAGSTALIQDLDPEEARRLIDPVILLMMEAVHHYEGYVAKILGDGILALCGGEHGSSHSEDGFFGAARCLDAQKLRVQIAGFDAYRSPGSRHQSDLEPGATLAHPRVAPLAGALVIPRTQARTRHLI
ncbi:hypothetical protein CTP10_R69630 (plasmid) [Cupriavidus sp. P-10]|nr:hypothetical protein CTP10_R69630 [Cupriavidus sp. P-10]